MDEKKLIWTGGIGAVIAAICCATPVLAILLGAVGLSALIGYLDFVLLPAFALCIALIGYGPYKQRQRAVTFAPFSFFCVPPADKAEPRSEIVRGVERSPNAQSADRFFGLSA